jgi:mannan endo-1,4-beta-mannosidase
MVMPPGHGGPGNDQTVTSHRQAVADADQRGLAARGETLVQRLIGLFQHSPALATVGSFAAAIGVAAITAVTVQAVVPQHPPATGKTARLHPVFITLPVRPASYLGAYADGVPRSYAPVESFAAATGVRPNVALYFSGWNEPLQTTFAMQAAGHGAVPLIQIEPGKTSLRAIAAGGYDAYLQTFADEVASFGARTGRGVIISFAHEPNGPWYRWGVGHVTPATWIAAWRHVVNVFRRQGADDVTWLWTVNIIARQQGVPSPARWWPGSSYVTWVGIDGYYYKQSWTFASLFGPTIKAVRALTLDPILISETGAAPAAGQPVKIADIFRGIHAYGLLGLVWFDAKGIQDWRLNSPAAFAAFRESAKTYGRPAS